MSVGRRVLVPSIMIDALEFRLDEVRYALPIDRVLEVASRVLIIPLPDVPAHVLGLVSYRGRPIVAIDLGLRLGHGERCPSADDHFIVARGARRLVALVAERVHDLLRVPPGRLEPPPVATPHVSGVAVLSGGLVLIEDLDAVLSLDEERAIDTAMKQRTSL